MSKAIIGITNWARTQRELRGVARQLDAGEVVPAADYHLNFACASQLFAELTPARMALLELLKRAGPLSIYALAKRAGRNYSNVHRDVQKLIEHDLVERDAEERVRVPWDEIQIRVSLGAGEAA